jgi:hypothetical protein
MVMTMVVMCNETFVACKRRSIMCAVCCWVPLFGCARLPPAGTTQVRVPEVEVVVLCNETVFCLQTPQHHVCSVLLLGTIVWLCTPSTCWDNTGAWGRRS